MPLEIIRNDITRLEVDAIVNAANSTLLGGGGVDGAIHYAAGEELVKECATLGGCDTGDAKLTRGYKLPAKYVIHTVGPIWRGGENSEQELLSSCYEKSLQIARENGFKSIAFPLISAGVYGYPKSQALKVGVDAIREFLSLNDDMLVYIVIYDSGAVNAASAYYDKIREYIDDVYVDEKQEMFGRRTIENNEPMSVPLPASFAPSCADASMPNMADSTCYSEESIEKSKRHKSIFSGISIGKNKKSDTSKGIDEYVKMLDESFADMLLRKIDEKGMTDPECYKKANVDRKLFSKIRNNPEYRPSKNTVLCFAIALELSLEDTREMLLKAGFALSHSNKFDVIIEYFIVNQIYDFFEINEALLSFDQALLGC